MRVLLDEELLLSLQDVVMVVGGTCIVGAEVTMLVAGVESELEGASCVPVGTEMMLEELPFLVAG